MKIGIIGSGIVGQTLAKGFLFKGDDVMIGTNDASKREDLKAKTGGKAKIGSFEEVARFGEILVLAAKGTGAESAVKSVGVAHLKGKIVIDATNPIADVPPTNGVLKFFTSPDESLMERLQRLAPEARFVKAFSCIGNALMVDPDLGGVKPSMFICGNDADAKKQVGAIVERFGFDVEDMGGVEAARAIEPLCILWCLPGFLRNDWMHALKMVRKGK
jgi:predicted dinucleotide-binding enzyme